MTQDTLREADRPLGENRPGDEALQRATGRTWSEWFATLDGDGAATLDHRGIVALTVGHGAGPWWAQTVAVGYEHARGKRALHERPGGFTASGSRTIETTPDRLYEALAEESSRAVWLPLEIEITTSTPSKSVRARTREGSRIDFNIYPKGDDRTQVTLQQQRLPDAAAADEMKASWSEWLDALKAFLED